jgi:XTP/dITP diphosphohydrolase
MLKLVFVTHNQNKLKEVAAMTPDSIELIGLDQIGCTEDIEETASTLQENAMLKAKYIYNKYRMNCFADDTGLEVEALDGRPGVYSARYAGPGKDSNANIEKLLDELRTKTNRKARFRAAISLILDGEEMLFEGIVNGMISHDKKGNDGFGYDPVFIPEGYTRTFAEMPLSEKNLLSHRYKAFTMLSEYLMSVNYL